MNKFQLTIVITLVLIAFIIILQNTQVMTLRLFLWEVSMSRIIFIPLLMLIGFVIGFLIGRKSWN
jgi:uncharacterized integral membrane protein